MACTPHLPNRIPLFAVLLFLCAILLPCAQAHCPSNRTCIKTGYFANSGFKPSKTLLTGGTPIVQAAQCIDLCTKSGFAFFSVLAGMPLAFPLLPCPKPKPYTHTLVTPLRWGKPPHAGMH